MQMTALRSWNDDVQFVLVVVDAFTKYCWASCLKTKSSKEVASAMTALFARIKAPDCLQTDKG